MHTLNKDLVWADSEQSEINTTCKLCLNCCGMIVSKTGDKIKTKGDPANPLSRGFLCLYPLKQIGPRGAQRWQRVSWEEAIKEISKIH